VRAGEAHEEPFLALAFPTPAPQFPGHRRGHVVAQPLRRLGDDLGLVGADLLRELAQRGLARRLALVDAALRHLPVLADRVDALADEDLALGVHQHDADIGAVEGIVGAGALRHWLASRLSSPGLFTTTETGASTSFRSSSPPLHKTSRSSVS